MVKKSHSTAPTGDVRADALRLLELLGVQDLARLAEVDDRFDAWSQNGVSACAAYAVRCIKEPVAVERERTAAALASAWGDFVTALKGVVES